MGAPPLTADDRHERSASVVSSYAADDVPLDAALAAVPARVAHPLAAPDAVRADPKHYSVEAEDERVRVVRIRYGAGEKSVMHTHPASVLVPLTDSHVRFTDEAGNADEATFKAGDAVLLPATTHLPENLGGEPIEGILIEFKR
jgi:quercetin dioxygenase-like cupin family protein